MGAPITNHYHNPEKLSPGEREHYLQQYASAITELEQVGFRFTGHDTDRPWGAFSYIDPEQEEEFLDLYFPDLTPDEARSGNPEAALSLKIIGVFPRHRLSFQYHDRRSELWRFITPGAYYVSKTNDPGERIEALAGDMVQFEASERHRLEGRPDGLTLVAEIWQHTNPDALSDEDDIIRLDDDYSR